MKLTRQIGHHRDDALATAEGATVLVVLEKRNLSRKRFVYEKKTKRGNAAC